MTSRGLSIYPTFSVNPIFKEKQFSCLKNYQKPEKIRLENSKKDQVGEIDQDLNSIESKNRKA